MPKSFSSFAAVSSSTAVVGPALPRTIPSVADGMSGHSRNGTYPGNCHFASSPNQPSMSFTSMAYCPHGPIWSPRSSTRPGTCACGRKKRRMIWSIMAR